VAIETSRGWRIAKEKQSYKVDVVVAMAMACLGAVEGQAGAEPGPIVLLKRENARAQVASGVSIEAAASAVGIGAQELSDWIDRRAAAPARLAAQRWSRPPAEEIEAWEFSRKRVAAGLTIQQAVAETLKVHRTQIIPDALAAYIARANQPFGPSRPRFAPSGAVNLFK